MHVLGRIILGWWYWITNANNTMAKERLKICTHCELRKGLVCGECGCVLQAKARLADDECPHPDGDKWKK